MEFRLKASLLTWALLHGSGALADGLMVLDPWIREAPPTAPALGGFMVVHNHSDREQAIVGASSPAFGQVELHRTVADGGVMRMVHQERIAIPAQGQVVLEPGGYHLMLMQPRQPLKAGDTVAVTLRFDDGGSAAVNYAVRSGVEAGAPMTHHRH